MSEAGICGRKPRSSPENFSVSSIARKMKVCHYACYEAFSRVRSSSARRAYVKRAISNPNSGRGAKFEVPLPDKLAANGRVPRKFDDGRTAENPVRVGGVLNPQFLGQ